MGDAMARGGMDSTLTAAAALRVIVGGSGLVLSYSMLLAPSERG